MDFSTLLQQLRPSQLAAALTNALVDGLGSITNPHAFVGFLNAIHFESLLTGTIHTIGLIVVLLAVVGGLEKWQGSTRSRYRSTVFARDCLYALFYHGGFYALLLGAAVANALESQVRFLKLDLLVGLPVAVHVAIYWILGDFIHYWVHRLEHSVGPLWAIHSVHHSQTEMSFISTYRFHPLEQVLQGAVMLIPLMVIGVPTQSWMLLGTTLLVFDAVQHSALDWTYGRGYKLLVSPRFHALHHSVDRREYNGNYGKILSVWDYMFGTAVSGARPKSFGVDGMPVPRTLLAQLLAPFRLIAWRPAHRQATNVKSRR